MRDLIFVALFLLSLVFFSCSSCKDLTGGSGEVIYQTDFSKPLGADWKDEGGDWRVEDGVLKSEKARNKDLVLTSKSLPQNAVIEFKMRSFTPYIDAKVRAWGALDPNGETMHDAGAYSFILGGWKGRISTIARMDEHDENRVEDRETTFKPETWLACRIERNKGTIRWFVNDKLFLTYEDDSPLSANQFKYFSFANWRSRVEFDDLRIRALP